MARTAVVDAWAALAFLQGEEPAATALKRHLRRAASGNGRLLMSAVNLGEVLYRLWSQLGEMEGEQRFRRFRLLPIDIVPARERLALDAARLKARHRLGYADAFAVATARDADASLLTGDPELLALPRAVVKTLRLDR